MGKTALPAHQVISSEKEDSWSRWLQPKTLKAPHTPLRLKPTANCLYPTTLLPIVWPVWQKSCIEHILWHAASSTVACTFCSCMRCNKWVGLHENRKWRNGVHRKTKRTQYSTPPTHHADLLAHCQSEWSYSWHTTNQRIQWLRRPTANLLRLHMLNRSRQHPHGS